MHDNLSWTVSLVGWYVLKLLCGHFESMMEMLSVLLYNAVEAHCYVRLLARKLLEH